MKISKHKYYSYFLTLIFSSAAVILTFSAIWNIYEFKDRPVNNWNLIDGKPGETIAIPFYTLIDNPSSYKIKTALRYRKNDILVFPRISGNYFRVTVNNIIVIQLGNSDTTGNFWMQYHYARLPDMYADKMVEIVAESRGIYDYGIREIPFLIQESDAWFIINISDFIFNKIYWILAGANLSFSLMLFLFASVKSKIRISFVLIALGSVFAAFYLQEYVQRETSGSIDVFLILRKVIFLCILASTLFFVAGMEYFIYRKFKITWMMLLGSASVAIFTLTSSSHIDLKMRLQLSYIFIAAEWLITYYFTIKTKNIFLIFFWSYFMFTLIYSIENLTLRHNHIYLLNYGYIAGQIGLAVQMTQEYGRVSRNLHKAKVKSLIDPLTGAYNRFILDNVEYNPGDFIALADLNHFKKINDIYGHAAGDEVLIRWVEIAREHIERDDLIVRLGGDEYLLILKNKTKRQINALFVKIAHDFKKFKKYNLTFSYGIENISFSLKDALINADRKMYIKKRNFR